MRADSRVLELTPESTLLRGLFGGYGGLGIVTEVELDLEVNTRLRPIVEKVDLEDYPVCTSGSGSRRTRTACSTNADLRPQALASRTRSAGSVRTSPSSCTDRLIPRATWTMAATKHCYGPCRNCPEPRGCTAASRTDCWSRRPWSGALRRGWTRTRRPNTGWRRCGVGWDLGQRLLRVAAARCVGARGATVSCRRASRRSIATRGASTECRAFTLRDGAEAPGLPRGDFGEFAGGVQGEGEQVENDEHGGVGVPAVAEVVFEVAAVLKREVFWDTWCCALRCAARSLPPCAPRSRASPTAVATLS